MKCKVLKVTASAYLNGLHVLEAENSCNPLLGICWRKLLGRNAPKWLVWKLCRCSHAEINLLRELKEGDFKADTVKIAGNWYMCQACNRALRDFGIKNMVFLTSREEYEQSFK